MFVFGNPGLPKSAESVETAESEDSPVAVSESGLHWRVFCHRNPTVSNDSIIAIRCFAGGFSDFFCYLSLHATVITTG
jgi:hypothetical protein